jgi:hypothetical protein
MRGVHFGFYPLQLLLGDASQDQTEVWYFSRVFSLSVKGIGLAV